MNRQPARRPHTRGVPRMRGDEPDGTAQRLRGVPRMRGDEPVRQVSATLEKRVPRMRGDEPVWQELAR